MRGSRLHGALLQDAPPEGELGDIAKGFVQGGGRLRMIGDVVAPLIRRSLLGAWLLVFIPATRELSTAIFLYGPNTRVMSVMLLNLADEGAHEAAAALGLLMLAAILCIVLAGYALMGRDFMVRRSE